MPIFAYEGRNASGKVFRGHLNAPDKNRALELLREQGLLLQKLEIARGAGVPVAPPSSPPSPPTASSPVETPTNPGGVALEKRPQTPFAPRAMTPTQGHANARAPLHLQPRLRANSRDLALFFRQLGALIHAGVGLGGALRSMSQNASGTNLREIAAQLSERVSSGEPLAPQLRAFPGVFSPLHVGIVSAGERGGFLESAFSRLARYCERDYEVQQRIKQETWYPKLVFAASIFIPSVVPLVLNGTKAWFISVAPTLFGLGVAWWAWRLWRVFEPSIPANNPARVLWDRLKLRVPIGGKVARGLATAKFCRALGALYSAGVGMGESTRLSADACGNAAIKNDVLAQAARLEGGESLSSVLGSTRHFPTLAMQMLEVGEQSGDLDDSLEKAADFLEGDAETAIRQALPALGILAFLVVAFRVGSQVVAMYGGYTKDLDNLMNQ